MQPPENAADPCTDVPPTIALVGASVRAAAESARRGGYRVIGIDRFGDTDTREICDKYFPLPPENDPRCNEIARAINGINVCLVGGLHRDVPFLQMVMVDRRPANIWRELGDLAKYDDRAVIRFPPCARSIDSIGEGRWLRKRFDSCGGLGVEWADQSMTRSSKEQLQQWIDGRPMGATLISDGASTRLCGICESLVRPIGRLPFVYAGSIGPIELPARICESVERFGSQAAIARDVRGLFNVDFILDDAGKVWVLEINPRWSASMELIQRNLIASGKASSLFSVSQRAKSRRLTNTEWESIQCDALPCFEKRIQFAEQPLQFARRRWEASLEEGETLHDIPADGTEIAAGEPICTVIAERSE